MCVVTGAELSVLSPPIKSAIYYWGYNINNKIHAMLHIFAIIWKCYRQTT